MCNNVRLFPNLPVTKHSISLTVCMCVCLYAESMCDNESTVTKWEEEMFSTFSFGTSKNRRTFPCQRQPQNKMISPVNSWKRVANFQYIKKQPQKAESDKIKIKYWREQKYLLSFSVFLHYLTLLRKHKAQHKQKDGEQSWSGSSWQDWGTPSPDQGRTPWVQTLLGPEPTWHWCCWFARNKRLFGFSEYAIIKMTLISYCN